MRLLPLTGFPRSGSTLLMSILDQNPIFEIGDDSEIGNLLYNSTLFIQANIGHFQLNNRVVENAFMNYCNAGTNAWVDTICSPKKIFIDKSRHWTKFLDLYFKIFDDKKVIFMIRDLVGICNSFEKIRCNSVYYNTNIEHHNVSNQSTIAQRAMNTLCIDYIEDAIKSCKVIMETNIPNKDNIYFCKYESLVNDPKNELREIYKFLSLPNFEHDFNSIDQKPFNDNPYMPWGNHKIKKSIESCNSKDYLNREAKELIQKNYKWYYDLFYPEIE